MGGEVGGRELSLRALVFGLFGGCLLATANVYAGLMLGMSDNGSMTIALASVVVMVPLGRLVGRPFTAREANVAQAAGTSAATMGITAGLLGPIPALALSGAPPTPLAIVLWGASLAVLGTLLALPFRGSFLELRQLAFPSGRATGELVVNLIAPGRAGRSAAAVLLIGGALAIAFTAARDLPGWIPAAIVPALTVGGIAAGDLMVGFYLSPLLAGVGLLVGLRVGLSILAAGVIAWCGIAPELVDRGLAEASYSSLVSWLLWPGTALMVSSSLTSLAFGGRDLVRAWRASRQGRTTDRRIQIAVAATALAAVTIGWWFFGIDPVVGALAVALATVFSVVAMHVTGETGQAPSGPLGGLSQIAVGAIAPGGVAAPLVSGGVVAGSVEHSSLMMNTWRAGQVVGSSPHRLWIAQLCGIGFGALCATGAYWVIDGAYEIGSAAMPSPSVLSWKATADAVRGGIASMPAGAPLAALIAAVVGVALAVAERRAGAARWSPSAVGLGIGFILPFSLGAAVAVAATGGALTARGAPGWSSAHLPALASGLIAGEGLAGVAIAAMKVAGAG